MVIKSWVCIPLGAFLMEENEGSGTYVPRPVIAGFVFFGPHSKWGLQHVGIRC